jgi:hypothetical protein
MKIRELTFEQRKSFKALCPIYLTFLKEKTPQLSNHSHMMYSRALSYIAIENNILNNTPKELCISLTKDILTTSDFQKIVGKDTNANQNIRLAAFRNLVNPFKDELQNEISESSYATISKLVSRKGTHIRKKIIDSKNKDLNEATANLCNRTWNDCQNLLLEFNKKYSIIVNKFLRTNEVPDYVTLRNILIINLYLNNYHKYDEMNVYTILRNEYRTAHLWINSTSPPMDRNNYFWINFEKNIHYLVIQSSKTVGGVRKLSSSSRVGSPSYHHQDKRRLFSLSNNIVNMILFIKQTFNERTDTPFLKNNVREGMITNQMWVRIIHKIFEDLGNCLVTTTIRKIYFNDIKWDKLTKPQRQYICKNIDNVTADRDIPKIIKNGIQSDNPDVPVSFSSDSLNSSEVVVF